MPPGGINNNYNYYTHSQRQQQPQQQHHLTQPQLPQAQHPGYTSYSSTSSTHAPVSTTQYHAAPVASGATSHRGNGYVPNQYGRTDGSGYQSAPTASYANRSDYDTSALGSLSYALGLNTDGGSVSSSTAGSGSYEPNAQENQQQAPTRALAQHNSYGSSDNSYGQQQTRPERVNSTESGQSRISATRMSPAVQTQYQPQRVASSQRGQSPVQAQWITQNQPTRESGTTVSHEYLARPTTRSEPSKTRDNQASRADDYHVQVPRQSSIEHIAPVTVNPTQVYDPYLEYQRIAQRNEAEAAKRRATEEVEAARKAKEQEVENPQAQSTSSAIIDNPPMPKKKRSKKKIDDVNQKSKEKAKAKSRANGAAADADEPAQAAAMTLMQTANSGGDLEAEMREMFRRMRDFNAKDPQMLSRLWQQERDDHLAKDMSKTQRTPQPPQQSPQQPIQQPVGATPATIPTPTTKASTSISANTASKRSSSQASKLPATAENTQSGTIWPADKKQTLAAAASRLLQAMPANAGKTITASEIKNFLDTNPSYIELCQYIEKRGFRVDVGAFAKALLAAVPGVTKTAQKPFPTSTVEQVQAHNSTFQQTATASAMSNSNTEPGSANTSLNNAATRLLNGGNVIEKDMPVSSKISPQSHQWSSNRVVGAAPPNDTGPDPRLGGLDAVKHFVDGSWQAVPSTATPVVPKSGKSSRKAQPRPSLPPTPVTKEDLARKRTFSDLVDLTQLSSDEEYNASLPPAKRHEKGVEVINQLPTPPETSGSTMLSHATSTGTAIEEEAGTLPNQHPLLQVSDLGDPAPPMPPAPILPLNHPARSIDMVLPIDKYKAIRRSTYNAKTIARDVLLACGRHPDMRHLNAHLEALKTVFSEKIDNTADLGTFRWDVADPGGPAPGSGAEIPTGQENPEISDHADDEDDDDNDSILGQCAVQQILGPNGVSEVHSNRRGAPGLLSKGKASRKSDPGFRSHADGGSRPPRPRHSEGAPARTLGIPHAGTPSSQGLAGGYSALRALQSGDGGEPVKKKGRPVGWRKWMQKDTGPSTPYKPSKLGKSTAPAKPEPEPVFQVYKCEWQECGAELHNLATLRRHIHRLHGKSDINDLYPCLWNECGKVRNTTENGRTLARFEREDFVTEERWKHHIETKHITPIAWKLGDGPAGGVSDQHDSELSDAYLSDSRGRRLTPTIVVPSPAARAAASTARPQSTAEREARELERLAARRKREIGPGVDRGGARLVTDKRRQGFMDDDDMAEVVEEDD